MSRGQAPEGDSQRSGCCGMNTAYVSPRVVSLDVVSFRLGGGAFSGRLPKMRFMLQLLWLTSKVSKANPTARQNQRRHALRQSALKCNYNE